MAAEEMVTIVDRHNNEIGAVERWKMRQQKLWHRATYVLVFNSRGDLFVQKRSSTKDVFPGYYDVVAGGVVLAGEGYHESAYRELEEELGIQGVPLERLFLFPYEDQYVKVWGAAFRCEYDGEVRIQREEIASGKFLSMTHVRDLLASAAFTPDGLYVLNRYLGRNIS
ncbi:MAG: NUDIX hydrolase YfcD [Deltaproteobacteria bacterium]|nr:NUDIX hydrolase YfcD [Deltaproteobacteria bacterium]